MRKIGIFAHSKDLEFLIFYQNLDFAKNFTYNLARIINYTFLLKSFFNVLMSKNLNRKRFSKGSKSNMKITLLVNISLSKLYLVCQ